MKNSVIFILLVIVALTACMKDFGNKEEMNKPVTTETFDIIAESGLKHYMSLPPNTTWRDLDVFYLEGIEKYRDRPELDNFKCAAIIFMVNMYNLLGDQSDEATDRINYYAQEMSRLRNCNPEVLYAMLMRMQAHWKPSKIARVASVGYNNSVRVFKLLDKQSPSYTKREKGMEDLKSLFEKKN